MIKQRAKQELPGRLVSVLVMDLVIVQESCLERRLEFLPLKTYSEKDENRAGAAAEKRDQCRLCVE